MQGRFRCINVPMMDTNDLFIYLGFVPGKVVVTSQYDGQETLWFQGMANDASLGRVAAGDRSLLTNAGIKLVQFTDKPSALSSDPSEVKAYEFWKANGIQVTSDAGLLADDKLVNILVFEATDLIVGPCTHDGDTNNASKCTDKDVDFEACGVSRGHIVYNQSNGNIAFVGSLEKYSGTSIYNTINLVESDLETATAAADIDTDDVFFVYPPNIVYPRSDLGYMT